MIVCLKCGMQSISKNQLFDILKEKKNYKKILFQGFNDLFMPEMYYDGRFEGREKFTHISQMGYLSSEYKTKIKFLTNGIIDISIPFFHNRSRNIKLKLEVIENDILEEQELKFPDGITGKPELSKKEIPCSLIKLKSLEKDFNFEIRFVLYDPPKLLDDNFLNPDLDPGLTHEEKIKHDTNLAIIDTYTHSKMCSLDIDCVYHYFSFLDHFYKDEDKDEDDIEVRVNTMPHNYNLIDKMLEKSFRFLINEIYASIEQIIKEKSK